MTEKRFTVPIKYRFSHSKIQLNGEPLTNDELVRILNTNDGAFVENFALKEENKQLKDKYNEQSVQYEGLEEQIERLLDFKDTVFNLIDEKINKLKNINEVSLIPRESVEILKELKKELQE